MTAPSPLDAFATALNGVARAVERCVQRFTAPVIPIGVSKICPIVPDIPVTPIGGMGNELSNAVNRVLGS